MKKSLPIAALLLPVAFATSTALAGTKVAVCHASGNGSVRMLNISENAVDAHIAHGDWAPTDWFADADGDGFGDANVTAESCTQPDGFVAVSGDVDDTDASLTDLASLEKEYEEVGAESAEIEGEEDVEEY